MTKVYYILDIKNDSNEAMHAKEYFTSHDDLDDLDLGSPDMENAYHTDTTPAISSVPVQFEVPENEAMQEAPRQHSPYDGLGPPAQDLPEEPEVRALATVVELQENPHQIKGSRRDFYKYLFTEGNWTDLAATSLNWMLLDFTFYLLGVNSSSFVPIMFNWTVGPGQAPYGQLIQNARHIMEATCIGAVTGGAIAIYVMNKFSRRMIQMWGFIILGALSVVVGSMYLTLPTTNAHLGIVIFYGFCQLFFNLGKSWQHWG